MRYGWLLVLVACSSKPAAPIADEVAALRQEAEAHRQRGAWDQEAAALDRLLVRTPDDRGVILRRARLVLEHDRRDAETRDAAITALVARARAIEDGCDVVRFEEAVVVWNQPATATAVATLRDGLGRCADLGTQARLNGMLAGLVANGDPMAAGRYACAAMAAGGDDPILANQCASATASAPGVRALAQARLARVLPERLRLLEVALAAEPGLIGALALRLWTLQGLGRAADACAAIAPYMQAIRPGFDRDFGPEVARTTWMEHERGLRQQLGCEPL